ncbi:hypothetical protein LTR05_006886 [Lithohypha guttulata]|uniref:ferric-chelate reductase (NADPH) n=1 Tax=Lithohypha guttulata TaxID=1690604 RepID=A0AAN7Y9G2_9EURO|nr:hypothetical protein LTR05_006886 [Lithohypha guttulata]
MPSIPVPHVLEDLVKRVPEQLSHVEEGILELVKRVKIPINSTTPPHLIEAIKQDPWTEADKYALGWVFFCIILLTITTLLRLWNYWGDRIRIALYKDEYITSALSASQNSANSAPWEVPSTTTDNSKQVFFPASGPLLYRQQKQQSTASAIAPFNNVVALFRYVFYRPVPHLKIAGWRFTFPSFAVIFIAAIGLIFSVLYCFLPKPLFYESMSFGSPPLAIRAGMMSIALVPWIVALASKANVISFMTGIGHERLIVLHRWGAYICIILAIIHAVPYWYQSVNDPDGFDKFKLYFNQQYYIFTTGIAALVPLAFLVIHSLPVLRNRFYEVFVFMHIPVAWAFIGLLFWHCHNYLTSWAYLYTTVIIMVVSLITRLFYLNWMNPFRPSWLIGEESAVTILPENAVKVTIPTQTRWKPGQYAYLRMPGISVVQNHPFTIASLCSEDFPSEYGDKYRDMMLVFRPFSGFTKRVFDTATKKGPFKTYRSFIEGPYGGMQRQMSSFDQVIFFAGGSGITAIASQLLDLVKRMRDGKATTRSVHVIWAMKRPDIMEWFKEELRICREYAPAGSVHCHFFITSARRYNTTGLGIGVDGRQNRISQLIAEKVDDVMQGIGNKRDSRLIDDFDVQGEELDLVTALPQKTSFASPITRQPYFPPPPGQSDVSVRTTIDEKKANSSLSEMQKDAGVITQTDRLYNQHRSTAQRTSDISTNDWAFSGSRSPEDEEKRNRNSGFDFGFPETPTRFQKSLMRFAFLPGTLPPTEPASAHTPAPAIPTGDNVSSARPLSTLPNRASLYTTKRNDGWRTEYGRPDISFMLKNLSSEFSRRTCIYVCGPAEMRCDVARTVADLQKLVWTDPNRDEIFLHAENYAI